MATNTEIIERLTRVETQLEAQTDTLKDIKSNLSEHFKQEEERLSALEITQSKLKVWVRIIAIILAGSLGTAGTVKALASSYTQEQHQEQTK